MEVEIGRGNTLRCITHTYMAKHLYSNPSGLTIGDFITRLDGWLFHYSSINLEGWNIFRYNIEEHFRLNVSPRDFATMVIAHPHKFCEAPAVRPAGYCR